MFARTVLNKCTLYKFGKSISQSFLNNIKRHQTTSTVALNEGKIQEVQIETQLSFVDTPCTPSSGSKIYPTRVDEYAAVPVMINGKLYHCNPDYIAHPYPLIPSIQVEVEEDKDEDDTIEEPISIQELMNVEFAQNMPTILDEERPERDKVNFPREKEVISPPGYRLLILPESWFKALYSRTGVTGPYCFVLTFSGFLMSKEYWILDHSFVAGSYFLAVCAFGIWKFGGKFKDNTLAHFLKQRQGWIDWREGSIKFLENYIKMKEDENNSMKNSSILFDAKRENIMLQQESEFRKRSMQVYKEALRKLNYQVALEEAKKSFSQKYMVDWIIDNVYKSITPQQQKIIFDQCLVDLKNLAAKKQASS